MAARNILTDLWSQQSEWSQRTFGADSVRGPNGPLKHLKRECDEAMETPSDITEFADCGLLWLDAARRAGHSLDDLIAAMYDKQAININRKWGKPDGDDLV